MQLAPMGVVCLLSAVENGPPSASFAPITHFCKRSWRVPFTRRLKRTYLLATGVDNLSGRRWASSVVNNGYTAHHVQASRRTLRPKLSQLGSNVTVKVPIFPFNTLCPTNNCPETLHFFGDHLMHCLHGRERIDHHDSPVTILTSDLAKAARHPITKPRPHGQHQARLDIWATESTGGTDFFDVTFVNPLAPSNTRARRFKPLTSLHAAKRQSSGGIKTL
eukprot:GFKZ01012104.1.p1 GENE.GFKZ01012104.1~~GFKZ01012104.1.p1  ORF type:complete len:220 (+),score=4.40 GFKZ01012104.1:930-1589(+)